jgi:hypothetical protein
MTDFDQEYARHKQAVAKANELNKTVLFDALAALGVTSITVDFDGEGDSGQINSVAAFINDQPFQLPTTALTIHHSSWGSEDLMPRETRLEQAIEDVCYGYLEQTNGGWENNDGAYGEFTLSVATREIELDFNQRFSDSHHTSYTF